MGLIEFIIACLLGVLLARKGAPQRRVLWSGFALGWAIWVFQVVFWVGFGLFIASAYGEDRTKIWPGLKTALANTRFDLAETLIFVLFLALYVLAIMFITWLAYWAYGRMTQKERVE